MHADLATAFIKVLGNPKASKQVYNISGSKYVTFDGIAQACAKAGGFPEPEIIHYNPKDFDFGKKKAFPFRDQHFFASVEKASKDLGVTLEYDLLDGLTDSYNLDFDRGTFRKEADFTTDDMILGKKLRANAFSTSANATAGKTADDNVHKDAPKKDIDDQIADIQILRNLWKYLRMNNSRDFNIRIVLLLGLLVGAKVINVQVPFLFKLAIDWLAALGGAEASLASFTDANATLLALFASPGAVLIGYGIARSGVSACTELRNALFSKVTLRAIRSVSRMVFSHLHEFDLRYHLSRQTGALNRIIDRGSNAINFILTVTVFNIVPTILEWRTKFRTAMNKADN
ncbi:ABC transporter B family member 25 [Hordeum vulgare]|nr:ABC transporter B family member 25 [Hordeum vulgare]